MTLVWSSDREQLKMTRTSATIASWTGTPDFDWKCSGPTVTHHDSPKLHAVNLETAHALAVALRGPRTHHEANLSFTTRGNALLAGPDLLAHASTRGDAEDAAARLSSHPAAAVLGAGLAVAADPECTSYVLDPGWLLAHDHRPWPLRVEQALAWVGCESKVLGDETDATIVARYRGVDLVVLWQHGMANLSLGGFDLPGVVRTAGPLAAVSHGLRLIDALPDSVLVDIALRA